MQVPIENDANLIAGLEEMKLLFLEKTKIQLHEYIKMKPERWFYISSYNDTKHYQPKLITENESVMQMFREQNYPEYAYSEYKRIDYVKTYFETIKGLCNMLHRTIESKSNIDTETFVHQLHRKLYEEIDDIEYERLRFEYNIEGSNHTPQNITNFDLHCINEDLQRIWYKMAIYEGDV